MFRLEQFSLYCAGAGAAAHRLMFMLIDTLTANTLTHTQTRTQSSEHYNTNLSQRLLIALLSCSDCFVSFFQTVATNLPAQVDKKKKTDREKKRKGESANSAGASHLAATGCNI